MASDYRHFRAILYSQKISFLKKFIKTKSSLDIQRSFVLFYASFYA